MKKTLFKICAVFVLFCTALAIGLPRYTTIARARGDLYPCTWEDGSVTEESYSSAYENLRGLDGAGLLLRRNGKEGKIPLSSSAVSLYETLEGGDLAALLNADSDGLSPLEKLQFLRSYSERLYISDGELFAYTGKVERTTRVTCREVVLVNGETKTNFLAASGATKLILFDGAKPDAEELVGSKICEVDPRGNWRLEGDCICRRVGEWLYAVAGLPQATELDLTNVDLILDGALLPCKGLTRLTVPFVGDSTGIEGYLGRLFLDGGKFAVPDSLIYLKATGGKIGDHAFYGCRFLKEIDLCGIAAERIAPQAFGGLHLERLHTQKEDALPSSEYSAHREACGCFTYVKNI